MLIHQLAFVRVAQGPLQFEETGR